MCHMSNKNKTIVIPISEYDVEQFREITDGSGQEIHWSFHTEEDDNQLINVVFKLENLDE